VNPPRAERRPTAHFDRNKVHAISGAGHHRTTDAGGGLIASPLRGIFNPF
jgi:hypothetical protein